MAGDDVLAGAPRVPVSRCPAQGGAAVLRPGHAGPGQPAQGGRGGGVVGVEPGRVPGVLPPVQRGRLAGDLAGRVVGEGVVQGGGPPHVAGVVVVEVTGAAVAGLTLLPSRLVQGGHRVLGGPALAAGLLELDKTSIGEHPLSLGTPVLL